MKKIILLFLVSAVTFSAYSQRQDVRRQRLDPEAMAVMQTNSLNKVLELYSLQYSMVMLMNYSDAMAMQDSMKVRAERGGERRKLTEEEMRARREVMKQRRALRDEQMQKILTPEQYEKYLNYMKEIEKNARPMGRGPRREGPPSSNKE